MLRVTIDLVAHGNEATKSTIGVMHVSNVGGTPEASNYNVNLMAADGGQRQFTIKGINREQGIFEFMSDVFTELEKLRKGNHSNEKMDRSL